MRIIAVDPGAAHVGVAHNLDGKVAAFEYGANEWLIDFDLWLREAVDVVICEAFVLYPSKAKAQSWSPMATSEMIGAMKYLAKTTGVEFVEQGANIKIPTRAQCKARGVDTKNKSGHASDALLHLLYYALRNDIELEVG